MPNFRPVLNILPVDFGVGVLVPGEKQNQLLDLSFGLGLQFDNKLYTSTVQYTIHQQNEFCVRSYAESQCKQFRCARTIALPSDGIKGRCC